ncbi:MAG: AMP-binding protein [Rhodospirillaceae bacterium]|nr:AMP-binding protein [Rhodospirillaceae bacterium]
MIFGGDETTLGELDRRVNRFANGLAELGFKPGERVALMLSNHPDHFYAFLACAKLGLVQVPANIGLRGASLEFLFSHADPHGVIADGHFAELLVPALAGTKCRDVIWRGARAEVPGRRVHCFGAVMEKGSDAPPPGDPGPEDVLSISYTSGTTGQPKGVMVTDSMFRAAAYGALRLGDIENGDVLYLWEPLFHIGGSEVIVLAVFLDITIALTERFSASRFWAEVREAEATHIHHLGGILAILMKQPPSPADTEYSVRVAWGAGAPAAIRRQFAERFGVKVTESYGMTECSSVTTVNAGGDPDAGVGVPLPHFEVRIADDEGQPLGPGAMGEVLVREKEPGFVMAGYFRNREATELALRDGWMHTGDLGSFDEQGNYHYLGRKKDSLRRRGENVSAWEVERVLLTHPRVEECAVVGVDTDVGEQDIKAYVKPVADSAADPLDIVKWCEGRLAYFQVPRYIEFVDGFAKTPTERVRKETLSKQAGGAWDLDASGYRLRRD